MYKAAVNDNVFDISGDENSFLVNGHAFHWDLAEINGNTFHILYNNRGYSAEVVSANHDSKTFAIKVNNKIFTVAVKDRFDLLLEKMGISNGAAGKVNNIKAPMPGLIIDLKVNAGDVVKAGDSLLILEAMKMENIIKSPGEGVIRSVKIKQGDSVEKGQVLIEF